MLGNVSRYHSLPFIHHQVAMTRITFFCRGARLLAVAGWWLGFVCHPRTPLETEQPPTPTRPSDFFSFNKNSFLYMF